MLLFCKSHSIYIINGHFGTDAGKGEYTFINQNGCSVIDCFLATENLLSSICDFEVLSQFESSHFPLSLSFRQNECDLKIDVNTSDNENTIHYNMNIDNSNIYLQNMSNSMSSGNLDVINMIDDKYCSVENVVNEFEKFLFKCSESFTWSWHLRKSTNKVGLINIAGNQNRRVIKALKKLVRDCSQFNVKAYLHLKGGPSDLGTRILQKY